MRAGARTHLHELARDAREEMAVGREAALDDGRLEAQVMQHDTAAEVDEQRAAVLVEHQQVAAGGGQCQRPHRRGRRARQACGRRVREVHLRPGFGAAAAVEIRREAAAAGVRASSVARYASCVQRTRRRAHRPPIVAPVSRCSCRRSGFGMWLPPSKPPGRAVEGGGVRMRVAATASAGCARARGQATNAGGGRGCGRTHLRHAVARGAEQGGAVQQQVTAAIRRAQQIGELVVHRTRRSTWRRGRV